MNRSDAQRQSKYDKWIGGVLNLYNIAERLSNTTLVVKEIHSVFSEGEESDRSKESALRDIEKNLISLLKHASNTVRISTTIWYKKMHTEEATYHFLLSNHSIFCHPATL